ncbi:hypothetical protein [Paenibacillus tuaregi]|uniref:hypothetical protein n=1 Tax=Paenibacillus tuaregi TaxID=1816681 RepID=UPI0008388ADD|nr:hypothetical protein [Paenibacillus tuaregi]
MSVLKSVIQRAVPFLEKAAIIYFVTGLLLAFIVWVFAAIKLGTFVLTIIFGPILSVVLIFMWIIAGFPI